jgi:hypothetical protein
MEDENRKCWSAAFLRCGSLLCIENLALWVKFEDGFG